MKKNISLLLFILISNSIFSQIKDDTYFSNPIIADSLSSLMIPIQFDFGILNSSKLSGTDYYSNILFYNFLQDSTKRLFNNDTYIKGFKKENYYYNRDKEEKPDNITSKWIFYFVKSNDYNKNGKIDNDDPYTLFVSDKNGNALKSLTPQNENAVSIHIYEKQGFALIKMQRDLDKDEDFESDDKDFYYLRLNLNSLTLEKKIEKSQL